MLIKTTNSFGEIMAAILSNLRNTVIAGLVLTVIMVIVVSQTPGADKLQLIIVMRRFF